MFLRELFDTDQESEDLEISKDYDPAYDDSIRNSDDVRKTQLTLRQINRARKASEFHQEEKKKEIEFIQKMYGQSGEEEEMGI